MPIAPLRISAVIFPGFELLDVFGPLEMFGLLGERARIQLIADRVDPIASSAGVRAIPDTGFGQPNDVLLVPGGIGTRQLVSDSAFLANLKTAVHQSTLVASVCTGSGLLAATGLLDGRRATSNKIAFEWAASQGPAVKWNRKARWVQDGKIWTSSGIAAGIDMSVALIAHLFDESTARDIAHRAEYIWNNDSENDPFTHQPA